MSTISPSTAWADLESVCNKLHHYDTILQCIHILPSGRRCRKQLFSNHTDRLITLWHSAQNSTDFWLSSTKRDLKHLVQELHCSVHHAYYHNFYLACHKDLFAQQQHAWVLAKIKSHCHDRRWLDLTAEVEAKQSRDLWTIYFYCLSTEDTQKKIPWPSFLEGHIPKLSSDQVADFFMRSVASTKYGIDFTSTKAVQDLNPAVNFLGRERSR